MKVDDFVSRLTKARKTGNGRWVACCPAHEDKHPSLNVKEGDDGKVLIICRAGCAVYDIVSAVGVKLGDLFPDKPLSHREKPLRRPFPAADVLEALANETLIVSLVLSDIENGIVPSEADIVRFKLAAERIESARSLANG